MISAAYIKDIAGLGEVSGHAKDLTLAVIRRKEDKKRRDLEDDALRLKNREQELNNHWLSVQNMEAELALCVKYEISVDELRAYMAQLPPNSLAVQSQERQPLGLIS